MVTPGADDRELVEQNGLSRWFFDPLRADPRLRADEAVRRSTEGSRRRLAHQRGGTLAVGVPRHRTAINRPRFARWRALPRTDHRAHKFGELVEREGLVADHRAQVAELCPRRVVYTVIACDDGDRRVWMGTGASDAAHRVHPPAAS